MEASDTLVELGTIILFLVVLRDRGPCQRDQTRDILPVLVRFTRQVLEAPYERFDAVGVGAAKTRQTLERPGPSGSVGQLDRLAAVIGRFPAGHQCCIQGRVFVISEHRPPLCSLTQNQ
ncbi:MAG TPA: hypothetical protein VLT88_07870 [Desulfosarcina sp.]|nr:hypothetical protein [Desulfosarcina sp.]